MSAIVVGGVLGAATLMQGGTAEAGRVHFSGGGHFSGSARFSGRWHGSIHFWRPRVWVGGSVWIGGGYYYPRSYYYYPQPEAVPSYYGGQYYPVEPTAAPGLVAVAAPRPAMPTFGVGVFAGGMSVKDKQDSSDLGLLARIRLTPGLIVEGEIGKDSFKGNVPVCQSPSGGDTGCLSVTAATREDRRIGGSLIWEIGAYNAFAPYILAGGGVQQAKVNGDFSTTQEFGEIGVGLRWALSRNLHLAADVRAGRRKSVDSNQPVNVARSVAPPSGNTSGDDTEDFTRGRLAAILNF